MMKPDQWQQPLLVVMAIIFSISYPQRQDIFWAFIMHVSGAAMIGGLADWYAVTALFTKPLGIPLRPLSYRAVRNVLYKWGAPCSVKSHCVCPQMYYAIKKNGLWSALLNTA